MACRGCWNLGGSEGRTAGKPEVSERSRSGRADEGSGLCPWVYGAGLDPMGGIAWLRR